MLFRFVSDRAVQSRSNLLIFDGSLARFLEPQPHLFLDASRRKLIGFQTATNEATYAFKDFPIGLPEELEAGGQPCPDVTARSTKDLRRD